MPSSELESLRQQLRDLQQRNTQLETRLAHRDGVDEDLYRFLFDTMDEGFCVIEFIDGPHGPLSDYNHVTANAAYTRHTGISDVVGKTLREIVPAEADDWIARYGAVLHSGEPLQFEQELLATERVLSVTSFRIEPAARCQVAVLFQDVTERRRAEKALHKLNQQLEQRVAEALSERMLFAHLVDNSVARVQVIDTELRCLAINQQARMDFESLFAHAPEVGERLPEILGKHPEDCSRVLAFWHRALSGEAFMEVADFGSGHRRRAYELHFSPLRNPEGLIDGAYLFAYDISDRVQEQQRLLLAEEALRQAQKMELLGQLTGGIAHDFNNLLAAILGAQELMRLRVRQERFDALPPLLDIAGASARRAASLVQRLLAFSRRQTLQPQATDMGELLDALDELLRHSVGAGIELQIRCAPALWLTCIDAPQLESALLNLCFNARDAMPDGGSVRIDCENALLDHAQASALDLRAGEYLHMSLTDDGQGMSSDVAERAIDPFFTTKPMGQGSGLGLSMAYGFMRQSGGQLQIDSTPGQGTCIHIYLPRHVAATPPVALAAPTPGVRPANPHTQVVLLVEDQANVRSVVREVLEDMGLRVVDHGEGASALSALNDGLRPDLLVSDIGLPGGLNGHQLSAAVRQIHPQLPVLFISGHDQDATSLSGKLAPGISVMSKPFDLDTLARRVARMLGWVSSQDSPTAPQIDEAAR